MRLSIAAAIACLCIAGVAAGDRATAAIKTFTNIPAEGLGPALQTLAQAHDLQVVYLSEAVDKLKTSGAVGEFTADEALKRLLKGTGLTYRYLDEKTVTVQPIPTGSSNSSTDSEARNSTSPDVGGQEGNQLWERFRLAQANQVASHIGIDTLNSEGISESSSQLSEILVTAQKKTEREQDVPIAITVLDADALAENGQTRLQDYFASVPGLSFAGNNGAELQYLTIRGLSAGQQQNSTVATVVDDVPVGSGSSLSYGNFTQPDLDPSDLARIEVLKGPQGTLYGADSLGGLVKYVTAEPSTTALTGRVEAGGSDIPGGGAGYAVRAAANIPLSDEFAIRISGFDRRDPGYIDDLTTGQKNINSVDVYGGHLAFLYRPSENFSLKLGALFQNTNGDAEFVNSNSMLQFLQGNLNQTGVPGTTAFESRWQLYTATLNAKVAGVDIVSVTGYNTNLAQDYADFTACCAGYLAGISTQFFPGSGAFVAVNHYYTEKFSQEIRLSSSVHHWLDWTVGGFYTHEASPYWRSDILDVAANIKTGTWAGLLDDSHFPFGLEEHAAFGDLTFHLTDRWDLQVGGRQAWDTQHYQNINVGPGVYGIYGVPSPDIEPAGNAKGTPFTYLVTPKYAISPDLQVYARIASGYRLGGPNFITGTGGAYASVPEYYQPDKTTNFEVGVKGDLLNHLLNFDVAAYFVKWTNFQLSLSLVTPVGTNSYIQNAGDAKSEGIEFSVDAHPATGLTVGIQGSYDNAVLTQDLHLPPSSAGVYGLAGDRLPYSIKFSGGFTGKQEFELTKDWVGFVGGSFNYIGPRPGEFAGAAPPAERVWFPGYTQLNLRTGARYQSWLVNLYVNNVTDKIGIVGYNFFGANIGNTGGAWTNVTQPRTVGLNVSRSF